ncbi:MAG: hypothetical protein R3E77_11595 [Steroidobacteraceae bacterium]
MAQQREGARAAKSIVRPDLDKRHPGERPLRALASATLQTGLDAAIDATDGLAAAHHLHELWMRGARAADVESGIERIWRRAAATVPDWLPMRYIDWLATAYEVCAAFSPGRGGRHNIYLVLLDYSDSRQGPHGAYVGMTSYAPALRFDQHKAGIRAAGSVLRRGLELLTGPVMHLRRLPRGRAAQIEAELAIALGRAGIFVKGGH